MKTWILVILVLGALIGASFAISRMDSSPYQQDLGDKFNKSIEELKHAKPEPKLTPATMNPGKQVVELNTNKGIIDFVLFEQDCPKTTARIMELVKAGHYNGVQFKRVENWLIQTESAKLEVPGMGVEVHTGCTQAKGTIGMARTDDPNSNTSAFYILLEPAPHLDLKYTNFGRLIKGMDVALKIKKGDEIKSARLRPLTDDDKKRFDEVLKIQAERTTQ